MASNPVLTSLLVCMLTLVYTGANAQMGDEFHALQEEYCNCTDTIDTSQDKLHFQADMGSCLLLLSRGVDKLHKRYPASTRRKLFGTVVRAAARNCEGLTEKGMQDYKLQQQQTASRITDSCDCNLLRKGVFYNLLIRDSITTVNKDGEQLVTYHDNGTYTRSRIHWVDSCSYLLEILETSDHNTIDNNDDTMGVRIIEVRGDTIIYEMEILELYNMGMLKKIE